MDFQVAKQGIRIAGKVHDQPTRTRQGKERKNYNSIFNIHKTTFFLYNKSIYCRYNLSSKRKRYTYITKTRIFF